MGFSSTIAMAAGAGMSAVGSYNKAQSQQDMLEAEAQIATWQSAQAIQNGQTQEQSSRLQTGELFGAQRAQLAANGVDLGSGSALDLLTTTKYMGNRDALTIHDNALRTAWGYTTQSNMDKSAASAIDPGMSAMTSLIGSAGTVSSSWNTWQKAGGTVPTWAGGKG